MSRFHDACSWRALVAFAPDDTGVAAVAVEAAAEAHEAASEASAAAAEAVGAEAAVAQAVERQEAAEAIAENMADAFAASETGRRMAALEGSVAEWHGDDGRGARLEARVSALEAENRELRSRLEAQETPPQTVILEPQPQPSTSIPLPSAVDQVLEVAAEPAMMETPPDADVVDPPVVATRKRRLRLL